MNHRLAGLITAIVALLALGVAYYAQFVLLLTPCELCLWERWPYRIVAVLGVVAFLAPRMVARAVLALAVLVLLGGMGVSGLHVGVEFGWWKSPLPECNGALTPGAPLPMLPAVPCDRPVYLIPHFPFSMAAMDFCGALVFALVLGAYVLRQPRRFG